MSDETREATDKAFWLQIADVVKATIDESKFTSIVEDYASKANIDIGNPSNAVEVTAKNFSLLEEEKDNMMGHLLKGGDLSLWGLANSVTQMAHAEEVPYDRAVELEEIGGQIMELPQSTWN